MLDANLDRVWSIVSSVDRITRLFPDLESSQTVGPHTTWVLKEQHGAGVRIRPRTTLRISFEERSQIRIEHAGGESDNARIGGRVDFVAQGDITRVTAFVELAIALPIPFFTVPVARAIAQRRVERIVSRLLANVRSAAGA